MNVFSIFNEQQIFILLVPFIAHLFLVLFSWSKWSYGFEQDAWYRLLVLIALDSLVFGLYAFAFSLILFGVV